MLVRCGCYCAVVFFFFQAEDGIRDLVRSRGLGDVYKRQHMLVSLGAALFMVCSILIIQDFDQPGVATRLDPTLSLIHI